MTQTGINYEDVKTNNRGALLTLLNDRGPMSRKDISTAMGLTPAGVTLITNELIANDIIRELGVMQENKRAGRRKILLGINYDVRYAIAISIEMTEVCITICNLKGDVIGSKHIPALEKNTLDEAFLMEISRECKLLLWESNVVRQQILGVGVSVWGRVDRGRGISFKPNSLSECWHTGEILQKELGFPVVVENNVKAFAEAGMTYAIADEQPVDSTFYVKWGPGVGSALVFHNQIFESKVANAFEIGHIRVRESGKLCRCGRRGCLETVASTHAIAEAVRNVYSEAETPELFALTDGDPSRIKSGNISEWATVKDEKVRQAFHNAIQEMVHVVGGAMTVVAPDTVCLYGYMFDLPGFEEDFLEECKRYDISYNEEMIRKSKLRDRIDYIGPLAVAVNELFYSGKTI